MKRSKLLGLSMFVVLSGLVVPWRTATATLSPLASPGETVVFSDDFDNNNNGWTTAQSQTIGADPGGTGATVWYPTSQGVLTASSITFANPIYLNAAQHQIDVYMRVRDNSYNVNSVGNYFLITLQDVAGGNYMGQLKEFPGSATGTQVIYRIPPNYSSGTNSGAAVNAGSSTTFVDYRLQMDFVPAGGAYTYDTMNLKASYKIGAGSWTDVPGASATGAKLYDAVVNTDGAFKYLAIWDRNSSTTADYRGYFDSVQISTVPEPATLALLALGGGLFLRRRRQEA